MVRRSWMGCALLLGLVAVGATRADEGTPVLISVIVNPGNPEKDLSVDTLKQIYRQDRKFWSGTNKIVTLVLSPETPEGVELLGLLGWESKDDYDKYWVKKVFRGEASAPPEIAAPAAAVKKVQTKAMAIGFVVGKLDPLPEGVKVMPIGGKMPGEDGYPLVFLKKSE